jgi:type II restriction enzyme
VPKTLDELLRVPSNPATSRKPGINYINPRTRGKIVVHAITEPEGPIYIKRYSPAGGETLAGATPEPISPEMIWRIANALRPGVPINFDRVLGGSYNTRSVFEALLAHSPQFYFCYPGRIELVGSRSTVKRGHKHLVWLPENPHIAGILAKTTTDIVISEIPTSEVVYEALVLPESQPEVGLDIEIARRHAQIQVALVEIGQQLGFKTWVAQNDRGIRYRDRTVAEMDTVIARLDDVQLLSAFA